MTPPKLEACPFCHEGLSVCFPANDGIRRHLPFRCICETAGCPYNGTNGKTLEEAVAAHNTLARQAALFGELVQVVQAVRSLDDVLSKRWRDELDALLTRARAAQSGVGS